MISSCKAVRLRYANIGSVLQRTRSCSLLQGYQEADVKSVSDTYDAAGPRQSQPVALDELMLRVEGEYREMLGMCVTAAQAERLWGLDATTCAFVLMTLVERRFLRRTSRGMYVRN